MRYHYRTIGLHNIRFHVPLHPVSCLKEL